MKALQTIQAVGLSCLLSIGAASCGSEESNQPYTPLQVYFDPVRVDMNAEHLMPYFVNYPTDWAKMGIAQLSEAGHLRIPQCTMGCDKHLAIRVLA